MANERHLYLVVKGVSTTSSLASEVWQTGVRLALVFGSVDDIGTLPNNWDPAATVINRTETSWTITGNWLAKRSVTLDTWQPDDYLNDQAAPAVAAWIAANKTSNQIKVTEIALYPCGSPLGKTVPAPPYASGTPCLLTMTDNSMTGAASGLLPLQNTVVASHRSSQIGRQGRGRMYLPPTGSSTAANGLVTDTNRDDIAAAHAAFLAGLSVTPIVPTDAHVRPIVTGKPFVNYSVINAVRVGNVMDTQQRRRRQIIESYTTEDVTY